MQTQIYLKHEAENQIESRYLPGSENKSRTLQSRVQSGGSFTSSKTRQHERL